MRSGDNYHGKQQENERSVDEKCTDEIQKYENGIATDRKNSTGDQIARCLPIHANTPRVAKRRECQHKNHLPNDNHAQPNILERCRIQQHGVERRREQIRTIGQGIQEHLDHPCAQQDKERQFNNLLPTSFPTPSVKTRICLRIRK